MIRLLFTFMLTIVAARWMYAEAKIVVPSAVPAIDFALENLQIPTHDRWDGKTMAKVIRTVSSAAGTFVQPAEAAELDSVRSYGRPVGIDEFSFRGRPCGSGACETF